MRKTTTLLAHNHLSTPFYAKIASYHKKSSKNQDLLTISHSERKGGIRSIVNPLTLAVVLLVSVLILGGCGFYYIGLSTTERFYYQTFYLRTYVNEWLSGSAEQKTTAPVEIKPLKVVPYKVVAGDTYWDIAKKTGLSMDTILSYNNPKDTFIVHPEDTLQIPIQNGILYKRTTTQETLEAISSKYDVTPQQIAYFNPNWEIASDLFLPGAYFSYNERLERLGAEFASPLNFLRITSIFGMRIHPITKKHSFHNGIDLSAGIGTTVYAAASGRVIAARAAHGYGNIIIISHGNQKFTRYAHLLNFSVKPGQRILRGQPIGRVGNTGISTGPHLHFEVWKRNRPINPIGSVDLYAKPRP
ncbi:hypothetical protein COTS27_01484 [Spirochaetota bacterium]|nr:hypothetical protein COTS27_01484 [Spirochaetota bacterium]